MLVACILMFCRVAIALLFALAFAGKIRDIRTFQESVVDFRLLPANWSKKLAVVFLAVELLACACVAGGGFLLLAGFLLVAGLLLLFSAALLTVIRRRMKVTCNCFGWTDRRVSGYDIVRNAVLILCSLVGAWTSITASQNLTLGEFGVIALIAVYFVVLMTNLANIVETLRQPFYAFLDR